MMNTLVEELSLLAIRAGKAILEVYNSNNFDLELKADNSPLTKADLNAHHIIDSGLGKTLVEGEVLPILSEEGRKIDFDERRGWSRYWLVDPLDGTKEFVKRNGEFTVNIALIDDGVPVLGVVYVPVTDVLYTGSIDVGAFRVDNASKNGVSTKLKGVNSDNRKFRVVASRSHLSVETEAFIDELRKIYGEIELTCSGSSLKICKIAEGNADAYPRFAPTMEWDTAAADAVCRAAGCCVLQYPEETPLQYNKENLLNPWFLVKGKNFT